MTAPAQAALFTEDVGPAAPVSGVPAGRFGPAAAHRPRGDVPLETEELPAGILRRARQPAGRREAVLGRQEPRVIPRRRGVHAASPG